MWHPVRDLLRPKRVLVPLEPQNGYSASGTASLAFIGRRVLRVRLLVSGLRPLSRHPAHIHLGHCGSGGPIAFPLRTLLANARGVAVGVTVIRGISAIPRTGWYINVHRGPTLAGIGATPIACGNVRPGRVVTYGGAVDEAELRELMPEGEAEPGWESQAAGESEPGAQPPAAAESEPAAEPQAAAEPEPGPEETGPAGGA